MVVEKIFLPSPDTELGLRVHKRVDRPSRLKGEDEEKPKTIRSLELSSEELGIHGVLDLVEVNGEQAIPVEYRKGRPWINEDGGIEPWPTDKVQIGLQCLLLKEAGYGVEEAVFYYSAVKRKAIIEVDDELLDYARNELAVARLTVSSGRPPPLLNSPKCPRCSLSEICLPDEVNLINEQVEQESERSSIRVLRKDGIQLIVQTQGARVNLSGDRIVTKTPDGQKSELPLVNLEGVCLYGNVQITTQTINSLCSRGVPIGLMTRGGKLQSIIEPNDNLSAHVRKAQQNTFSDSIRSLEFCRTIIEAKISNQRTLLMRNSKVDIDSALKMLKGVKDKTNSAKSIETLRGLEGKAAAIYFEHFPSIFKEPFASKFSKNGRSRRPPPDPINSVLSFGYSMLTNECVSALRVARLDPAIGALHVDKIARPSLALDLIEPLRPLIVDSIAISAFNRGELREGHFNTTSRGTIMTSHGRKAFFEAWGRRMEQMVKHPLVNHRISYRQMIHLHSKLTAAWMSGDVKELVMMKTR